MRDITVFEMLLTLGFNANFLGWLMQSVGVLNGFFLYVDFMLLFVFLSFFGLVEADGVVFVKCVSEKVVH